MQNGTKFMQKLIPDFKNHIRNLDKFMHAVESPKTWNLMGYFCPKNIFLQLKHYIQRIYLTLIPTTCVKIDQIPYVIFETISHFSQRNSSVFFSTQTLHTFHRSSPSKYKFSDFPLLVSKFTKFPMSFFEQKVSFSWKFGSFFNAIRDISSLLF